MTTINEIREDIIAFGMLVDELTGSGEMNEDEFVEKFGDEIGELMEKIEQYASTYHSRLMMGHVNNLVVDGSAVLHLKEDGTFGSIAIDGMYKIKEADDD